MTQSPSFSSRMRMALLVMAVVLVLALVGAAGYYLGQSRAAPAAPPSNAYRGGPGQKGVDPYVAGPLKNTLRKNALTLQQPWLQYLKEPSPKSEGSIELDWTLDEQGKPSRVNVIRSDFANPTYEAGIVQAVAKMEFPPPGVAQRYVSHTFVFKKEAP